MHFYEIFRDHTISLFSLGALDCVVGVLMHFYFWNTEGTLVPIDHCGFKDIFSYFMCSWGLSIWLFYARCLVMYFPGTPNTYWCEDVAQLWACLKFVPQKCKGLSVLGGLWHWALTLQSMFCCIPPQSQVFLQHWGLV